jgi:hypothetical protein
MPRHDNFEYLRYNPKIFPLTPKISPQADFAKTPEKFPFQIPFPNGQYLKSYIPVSLKAHSFGILPAFLYRFDIGMPEE